MNLSFPLKINESLKHRLLERFHGATLSLLHFNEQMEQLLGQGDRDIPEAFPRHQNLILWVKICWWSPWVV